MSTSLDKARAHLHGKLRAGNVPENLHRGLTDYILEGVEPGSFLMAALENDLGETFGRVDRETMAGLFELVCFLHNVVPVQAHRSPEKVRAWIAAGGMHGQKLV